VKKRDIEKLQLANLFYHQSGVVKNQKRGTGRIRSGGPDF